MNTDKKARFWNKNTKYYLAMQALNILFSLSSVVVNLASSAVQNSGLLSLPVALYLLLFTALMLVYAFFWQKVLKHVSLSSAYLSKGLVIFWTLVWAALLIGEAITVWNIVGAAVIFSGTLLVNRNE